MNELTKWASLADALIHRRPSWLTLFVTGRCNARCRTCFNWENIDKADEREELSIGELRRIADNFKGLHSLILSGGEPFMRTDLEDIVEAFRARADVHHVSIPTNMFCKDTAARVIDMARGMPDVFFRILASIDDLGERHDAIRGHRGGFAKLTRNLDTLFEGERLPNLSINMVTVLSSFNHDHIETVLDYADTRPFDDLKVIITRGNPREKAAKAVPPGRYREAIRYAAKKSIANRATQSVYNDLFSAVCLVAKEQIADYLDGKEMAARCTAGRRALVISEIGELFPCETLGRSFGSLRDHDYSVTAVLGTPEAKAIFDTVDNGECSCSMDCNTIGNLLYDPASYVKVGGYFAKILKGRLINR